MHHKLVILRVNSTGRLLLILCFCFPVKEELGLVLMCPFCVFVVFRTNRPLPSSLELPDSLQKRRWGTRSKAAAKETSYWPWWMTSDCGSEISLYWIKIKKKMQYTSRTAFFKSISISVESVIMSVKCKVYINIENQVGMFLIKF